MCKALASESARARILSWQFCTVLTKQMEAGGQLASVVDSASSFFGFLNPFNWFSSKPSENITVVTV